MRSEKLEKKLLFHRVKQKVACLKGVKNTNILESLSFNYDMKYQEIIGFYKYDAKGTYIQTHENGKKIQQNFAETLSNYLESYLSFNVKYYISFQGQFFYEFEIEDFKDLLVSSKRIKTTYDLSIFNANEVLVINDNEYDISIHYKLT